MASGSAHGRGMDKTLPGLEFWYLISQACGAHLVIAVLGRERQEDQKCGASHVKCEASLRI